MEDLREAILECVRCGYWVSMEMAATSLTGGDSPSSIKAFIRSYLRHAIGSTTSMPFVEDKQARGSVEPNCRRYRDPSVAYQDRCIGTRDEILVLQHKGIDREASAFLMVKNPIKHDLYPIDSKC